MVTAARRGPPPSSGALAHFCSENLLGEVSRLCNYLNPLTGQFMRQAYFRDDCVRAAVVAGGG